jgi:lysozyme family protein
MSYQIAISSLLQKEGGFQNNPNDYGNYLDGVLLGTKYGITPESFERYFGYTPTAEDMQTINKAEAEQFYYYSYWLPYNLDAINSQYIQNIVLDTIVLFSVFGRAQILPYSNNTLDINSINQQNEDILLNDIIARRIDYHNYIVSNDSSQSVFLTGWINRAESFKKSILGANKNNTLLFGAVAVGFVLFFATRKKKRK